MGRYPLLTLLALAVAACEPPPPPPGASADPHGDLACAQCHNGALADRSLASVPDASCTSSGCHARDMPGTVRLASVQFNHLEHGATETPTVGCAGCHTHETGGASIAAGPETCGLCHEDALSGARAEECRLCHATADHAGLTSQGVAVPHQGLPWIEGGCLRCHFAVSRPVHEVSLSRCVTCHDDVEGITAIGIGEDLHPIHEGIACGSCHEEDNHRIQAMSSAVELECASCHSGEHALPPDAPPLAAGTCNACHGSVHEGPQRILLGILPEERSTAPSQHFMDGLTCRSCHLPRESGADPVTGTSVACVQCHRPEYATVLRWWNQGIAERLSLVEQYVSGAEQAVAGRGAGDPAQEAVGQARALLALIRDGGGQHNLPLTHRMFEDALADASEAYRSVGRGVPPPPELGRAPRQGICSFCHYRLSEPGFSETMDDAFHLEVLGRR